MAVISSRFAPIIRTFVPFVAGAAAMSASKFLLYNLVGGILWTVLCVGAGYAFGNVPVIKENFSLVALGIVAVSLLPMVIEICEGPSARQPVGHLDGQRSRADAIRILKQLARGQRQIGVPALVVDHIQDRCPACSDTTTGN